MMLAAIFASGLLWRVAGADDFMARIDQAKAAYGRCTWQQAKARYRGADSEELKRSVMDACHGELNSWEDAMTVGATPAAASAARSAFEATVPALISITLQGVASCKKNEARASAADRALCENGGY